MLQLYDIKVGDSIIITMWGDKKVIDCTFSKLFRAYDAGVSFVKVVEDGTGIVFFLNTTHITCIEMP